jgi:tripartite-type tricarboxylate transporter receptor subunit TctC
MAGNGELLLASLLVLGFAASEAAAQGAYPVRGIRIVVPTAPGGGNDLVARMLAQGYSERMGRQSVVENRTGAGTMIGNEIVAKAKPDGYTLLMAPAAFAIIPAMHRKMPYDAAKDFAAITQAASLPSLIAIHPSIPAKSVKDMIALGRSRPGQVLFGSAGVATQPHLSMELFGSMAKIKLVHVPYKGTTPALTDLLAGQVAIMAGNMIQLVPYSRTGRLRALGVTTAQRSPSEPDIPTIAEGGLPGYESVQWYGLFAPAETPREIITRLNKETVAILSDPETKRRLAADGADVVGSSAEDFTAFMKTELMKWAKVVREAGIKPE